ncbi:MAG: 5'/3'-nucleotidase SurE [Chloroflexi bacterium]|nr:5'/3'-nucleotidase SurE [Chloroflexota bacterium]
MRILVTNDDGILSGGLWALAKELKRIASVTIVAPDREQSAIGTAVTLRQSLKVQKVTPLVPGIETYAVEGTPSDSVILALGKLINDRVDLVVSGINRGMNLGEDVHISGTVGAALQGYLRGCPALAVSAHYGEDERPELAARIAARLAGRVLAEPRLNRAFLNVNLPHADPAALNGVTITKLASETHVNTVEEGRYGWHKFYWLVRQRSGNGLEPGTDVSAVEQGCVSITPLSINGNRKPPARALDRLCTEVSRELTGA